MHLKFTDFSHKQFTQFVYMETLERENLHLKPKLELSTVQQVSVYLKYFVFVGLWQGFPNFLFIGTLGQFMDSLMYPQNR